jgi:predicted metal-dependent phosphoesterase TrpH
VRNGFRLSQRGRRSDHLTTNRRAARKLLYDNPEMLKAELHSHTSDDPRDIIGYDAFALIDRAEELSYQVVAITLHDKQFDPNRVAAYARERGIVLIPGIERTICGKHVLLLNFSAKVEQVSTFEELALLKDRERGIVVAPHPFFPAPSCLRGYLDRHASLFDAVEVNAFHTRAIDFNRRAVTWARDHAKPLIGNGDIHRLRQLGTTYSLIDADPDPDAICQAIRTGDVEVRTSPISTASAITLFASLLLSDLWTHRAVSPDRVITQPAS